MKKNIRGDNKFIRVNEQIRLSPVRVVKDGAQLGVMNTDEARRLAYSEGLDLVEIVPNVRPPVCSIIDYGKYKYQQSIKDKERKQKAKQQESKEIRLRPNIAENDMAIKAKHAADFLEEGKKVQITLAFKNRELLHREEGMKVVKKMLEIIGEVGQVVYGPKAEGKSLVCKLEPKSR